MPNHYVVKTLMLSNGERLPVLIDQEDGMPLFAPTVYSVTEVRARNRAYNTIDQLLRHLMVFHIFLDQRGIDLDARLIQGRVLDLGEIDDLVRVCRMPMADFVTQGEWKADQIKPACATPLEKIRLRRSAFPKAINSASASNRVRAIRDYLSWLVTAQMLKLPAGSATFSSLQDAGKFANQTLSARVSGVGSKNTIGMREGLAPEVRARLLIVIARQSPENPWKGAFTKARNELIFRWLHAFGLRRGELLNVKVSDIDFRKEVVTIVRRADDPEDPRRQEPCVKTRDRKIPIAPDLCRMTYDYVVKVRRQLVGARKHEFLFVADKTGSPMSLSAFNKSFSFLRGKVPDLPDDFSPHVLRHTWNDNFSAAMDQRNIPAAEEQKMRSFLMGWSETSGTAFHYTKRHTRQKANEVSLQMQAEMTGGDLA